MNGNLAISPQITCVFTFWCNNPTSKDLKDTVDTTTNVEKINEQNYVIPALFIITKDCKQPKCPSIEELLNTLKYTVKMEKNKFYILLVYGFYNVFF